MLFYPFTPFFVLFCNVIQVYDYADHHRMKDFVDFLSELKNISKHEFTPQDLGNKSGQNEQYAQPNTAVAKLYALCKTFCDLAAGVLRGTAAASKSFPQQASAPRTSCAAASALHEGSMPSHIDLWDDSQNHYHIPNSALSMNGLAAPLQQQQVTPNITDPSKTYSSHYHAAETAVNEDFAWLSDFAATQPMLRWLDADLSCLDSGSWDLNNPTPL